MPLHIYLCESETQPPRSHLDVYVTTYPYVYIGISKIFEREMLKQEYNPYLITFSVHLFLELDQTIVVKLFLLAWLKI